MLKVRDFKALWIAISWMIFIIPFSFADDHAKWVSIFNGKDLSGWTQRNGTATYVVEEGAIVGTTKDGSPNSFLCSDKDYSDFELMFKVKVDNRLNSGVQIRSKTRKHFRGRVNGPQVEIEASGANGAEAGYLYGEASGGWMTPKKDLIPHKHFKDGEWNQYRILAKGANIKVWINGQAVSDLSDQRKFKTHPKGFIGLQVHSIRKGSGPFQVRWKDIKIRDLAPAAKEEWLSLFDGTNLDAFQASKGNWVITENKELMISPRKGERGWKRFSSYLYSKKQFSDFILDLEYNYPRGGNSGVFFRIADVKNPVVQGMEAQILDSSKKKGAMSHHDHGGIIQTQGASKNMSKAPGEWNRMIIHAKGSMLKVKLNGEEIINIDLSQSKSKDKPLKGFVGLQDHGIPHKVKFRNIRIKELK